MGMEKIDIEKAKEHAEDRDLKPGLVKGTNGIQFTKGDNDRIKEISWEKFEKILNEKDLAIYDWNGYMKIMNDKGEKVE